eukprot:gene11560-12754_t
MHRIFVWKATLRTSLSSTFKEPISNNADDALSIHASDSEGEEVSSEVPLDAAGADLLSEKNSKEINDIQGSLDTLAQALESPSDVSDEFQCDNFNAGRVATFVSACNRLTNDPEILSVIAGAKIELDIPPSTLEKKKRNFAQKESQIINAEIITLLKKGCLRSHDPGTWASYLPYIYCPQT